MFIRPGKILGSSWQLKHRLKPMWLQVFQIQVFQRQLAMRKQSGIPYEMGLIKNRYVGRTFIQPSQSFREQGVKMKLSPVRGVVEGKRVIMVDDSIVRGTTSRRIVNMLKDAGATEVHVVISSPPIKNPCFYGIDTSTKEELIASDNSVEEIREIDWC